jgi:twitching motility protein PilT
MIFLGGRELDMESEKTVATEIKRIALQQFESVLKRAAQKKASDIHLKAGLPPIVRVHGNLYYLGADSGGQVARLTVEGLHDLALTLMTKRQREKYENGDEVDLGYEVTGIGRFRINVCQQRGVPRLVCRHIPDVIVSLDSLHLPPAVQQLCEVSRGLVLVTGATGSGKSTTLAALIDTIAQKYSYHILTIEDPIEFALKDRKSVVTQREVGLDTRSFGSALKYALRQDPDVILVGEMRDEETILMALAAAETGHLVFSTLHTMDAKETINRILGAIQPALQNQVRLRLASTLVAVVSQRLLSMSNKKGRVPAVEIMLNNARVRELIIDPKRTHELGHVIEESASTGMQSFDQSLMSLLKGGLITKEEAMANCSNPRDFELRLGGVFSGNWKEENTGISTFTGSGSNSIESQADSVEIDFEGSYKKVR